MNAPKKWTTVADATTPQTEGFDALALAIDYAERGWPAMPVAIGQVADPVTGEVTCTKRPLTKHGHLDATTAPDALSELFAAARPKPGEHIGVGVRPGSAGFVVLDYDTKHNGIGGQTFAAHVDEHGTEWTTARYRSASGALNVVVRKLDTARFVGNARAWPSCDVRADAGWIVAPGTTTPYGSWTWETEHLDGEHPLDAAALIPVGLWSPLASSTANTQAKGTAASVAEIERFLSTSPGQWDLRTHDSFRKTLDALRTAAPGGRHRAMQTCAASLIGAGMADHPTGVDELLDVWGKVTASEPHRKDEPWDSIAWAIGQEIAKGRTTADSRSDATTPTVPKANQPSTQLAYVEMGSITMAPVDWLWHKRIPLAAISLMPGREGCGKGLLATRLAAEVTHGRLAGSLYGTPAGVLFLTTEDSYGQVIRPRLEAAGADLDLCGTVQFPEGEMGYVELPDHVDDLAEIVAARGVRFIVLDPLSAYVSPKLDLHRDQDARLALRPLRRLAEATGASVLGISHYNKSGSTDPLTSVLGGRGIVASARAVIAVGRDPRAEAGTDDALIDRVAVASKHNLGPATPAVRYKIEAVTLEGPDGLEIKTARAVLGEEDASLTARDLMDGAEKRTTKQDGVADAILSALADGYVHEQAELQAEICEAIGCDVRTYRRAAKRLADEGQVTRRKRGFNPSVWVIQLAPEGDKQGSLPKGTSPSGPKHITPGQSEEDTEGAIPHNLSSSDTSAAHLPKGTNPVDVAPSCPLRDKPTRCEGHERLGHCKVCASTGRRTDPPPEPHCVDDTEVMA